MASSGNVVLVGMMGSGKSTVGLLVSVIPWAALPFTLWADRKGILDQGWRFTSPEEQPTTLPDKVLAQLVRHPARSILIILVLVAIVFTLLLTMGQPYDPDAIVESVNCISLSLFLYVFISPYISIFYLFLSLSSSTFSFICVEELTHAHSPSSSSQ